MDYVCDICCFYELSSRKGLNPSLLHLLQLLCPESVSLVVLDATPHCKALFSVCVYVCACSVAQSCLTFMSMTCSRTDSFVHEFPSRHECWSRLPFLSDPGIEPEFPVPPSWQAGFFTIVPHGKPQSFISLCCYCRCHCNVSLSFFFFNIFSF